MRRGGRPRNSGTRGGWKCEYCPEVFPSRALRRQHVRNHSAAEKMQADATPSSTRVCTYFGCGRQVNIIRRIQLCPQPLH